nr:glycine--tRNA ligase [Mycoplasma sp. Mirounga ES2805-ORL]
MKNEEKDVNKIIAHLKNSGFVFQGSEIYGGLANTWDYGPVGSLLKDNIAKEWKKFFIFKEENNHLIDSKILMNPNVWKTSGHVSNFNDPLIENKVNGKRYRADKLIAEIDPTIIPETLSFEQMKDFLVKNLKKYEGDKTDWTDIKKFNLMFETKQGVTEESKSLIYLRPETAQGIMVNFKNVLRATRSKLPMGIGQVGKSFRNEVTPGNFIFRTREFEQMELEVFCYPDQAKATHEYYIQKAVDFVKKLGIKENNFRIRAHDKEELSHYSDATSDIEYKFPFGWGELLGIANRTNFDLRSHSEATGEKLEYLDPITNEKFIPYVIEPSMGLDRLMFAIIIDAYDEEQLDNETRLVLRLDKKLAPYRVAILPLQKKLSEEAKKIYDSLIEQNIIAVFDETGSIGKRYRRQDSIGTPYCITFDFDSLEDNCVTIRDRDSMKQERIQISKIGDFIK